MAHEIFGDRFYGKREPAWHGLGRVFENNPTAVEAFTEAGLMYGVQKAPIFAYVNGDFIKIEDQWGIVRDPTADDPQHRMFGVVGNQYQVLNNSDIAPVVDLLSKEWPIETVGALKDGRSIFVTLKAGLDSVNGDELAKYFLLTDTKDGNGGAMKIAFTPIRVVCQNTLTVALRGNANQFSLIHSTHLEKDLSRAVEIIAASRRQEGQVLENFRRMAEIKVEQEVLQTILDAAYPMPNTGRWERHIEVLEELNVSADTKGRAIKEHEQYERMREYMQKMQNAVLDLYGTFCADHAGLAETPWAMYNAIVEMEDYRNGSNEAHGLLFGNRARTKAKAYTAAMKVLS